jgi:hypothetical protein
MRTSQITFYEAVGMRGSLISSFFYNPNQRIFQKSDNCPTLVRTCHTTRDLY